MKTEEHDPQYKRVNELDDLYIKPMHAKILIIRSCDKYMYMSINRVNKTKEFYGSSTSIFKAVCNK